MREGMCAGSEVQQGACCHQPVCSRELISPHCLPDSLMVILLSEMSSYPQHEDDAFTESVDTWKLCGCNGERAGLAAWEGGRQQLRVENVSLKVKR